MTNHEWCRREWDAGLGRLADAYGIAVRNVSESNGRDMDDDFYQGPNYHNLSYRQRILWLEPDEPHHEWLHEVAHIVCSPPWEDSPEVSAEFSGIFGWERAVGRALYRSGAWSRADYQRLMSSQDTYSLGHNTPPSWGGLGRYGEWSDVPDGCQNLVLRFVYRTLRMAGLLGSYNRPTWRMPVWSDEVRARWASTEDFAAGWPSILRG